MKNFKLYTMAFITLFTSMVFTSCEPDEDVEESIILSGQWYGDFGMYYVYEDAFGRLTRYDSYDTDIIFYPDYRYATHGYGKQVDYYRHGPYKYQYYTFDWTIRNGNIYLSYPHNHELDVCLRDYRMSNDFFYGYFESGSRFDLRKMVDYYDWDAYEYDYGYGWNDGWDYYDILRGSEKQDSIKVIKTENTTGQVVKQGNRNKDQE